MKKDPFLHSQVDSLVRIGNPSGFVKHSLQFLVVVEGRPSIKGSLQPSSNPIIDYVFLNFNI